MTEVNGIYAHNITYDYSGDTGAEATCGAPDTSGPLAGNDSIVFSGASATYSHTITFSNPNPNCSVNPSFNTASTIVNSGDFSFFASGTDTITTTYTPPTYGCTDSSACNYDASADVDDDTCEYAEEITCWDDETLIYPLACAGETCSDLGYTDSAQYDWGCPDSDACNYAVGNDGCNGSLGDVSCCNYPSTCAIEGYECGTFTDDCGISHNCFNEIGMCTSSSCTGGTRTWETCENHQCIEYSETCIFGCNENQCAGNTNPVANAGADQTYTITHDGDPTTNTVSFSLNGSVSDIDNNISSYTWKLNTNIIATNNLTPTVELGSGVYIFILTVIDSEGATHSDSVTITITGEQNDAPIVGTFIATCISGCIANPSGPTGVDILLNSTGFTDPDGDILTYNYTGTNGYVDNNSGTNSQDSDVSVGTHTYTVTVSDSYGMTTSASATITVYAESLGCTNTSACNYNADANADDGSCYYANNENIGTGGPNLLYRNCDESCISDTDGDGICDELEVSGCTDSSACNYDLSATDDNGSCQYPVDLHGVDYVDCDGNCLNDSDGDGVCDEEEISGCPNAMACNYNPDATDDDGSCVLPTYQTCYLDLDGDGFYNDIQENHQTCDCSELGPDWTLDIGSGIEQNGCTDATACNYDASATEDDGSCYYANTITCYNMTTDEELILTGCNQTCPAGYDDSSDLGCTDQEATNYNSNANEDNGTCEYNHTPNVQGTLSIIESETKCINFTIPFTNKLPDDAPVEITSTDDSIATGYNLTSGNCTGDAVPADHHNFNIQAGADLIEGESATITITVSAYGTTFTDSILVTTHSIIADLPTSVITITTNEDTPILINLNDYVTGDVFGETGSIVTAFTVWGNDITNGTLSVDGDDINTGQLPDGISTVLYTPPNNFAGGAGTFQFYVYDGVDDPNMIYSGYNHLATIEINVGAVSDVPTLTSDTITALNLFDTTGGSINEDSGTTTVQIQATDIDDENIYFEVVDQSGITLSITDPIITDPVDGNNYYTATSILSITPDDNFCGTVSNLNINMYDDYFGGGNITSTFSFNVIVNCVVDAFSVSASTNLITIPEYGSDSIDITISDIDTVAQFPTLKYIATIGTNPGTNSTISPSDSPSLNRILNIEPTAAPGTPVIVQYYIEKYIDNILQHTESNFINVIVDNVIDEPILSLSSIEIVVTEDYGPISVNATVINPDNFPITWPASDIVQNDVRVAFSNKTNTGATLTVSKEDEQAIVALEEIDITIGYNHDGTGTTNQTEILNVTLAIDLTDDAPLFSTTNVNVTEGLVSNLTLNITDEDPNHEIFNISIDIPDGLRINNTNGPAILSYDDDNAYQDNGVSKLDTTLYITSFDNFDGVNNYNKPVTVTVTDPTGNASTSTFTVYVTAVNDPPIIQSIGTITIDEDSTIADAANQIDIYVDDVDNTSGELIWTAPVLSGWSFMYGGDCALDGHTGCKILIIAPPSNFCGSITPTSGVIVLDGANDVEESFTIEVTCTDDAPTIANPGTQNLNEDFGVASISMQLTDVDVQSGNHLYSDIDISVNNSDPNIVGYISESISATGILTLTFISIPDANGTSTIAVTATDPNDATLTSTTSFNIVVAAVNDPPELNSILSDIEIYEGDPPATLDLTGYATDIEGDVITYQASIDQNSGYGSTGSGNNISWTIDANNILTITPDANWNGTITIYIRPYANGEGSIEYPVPNFNFTVIGVNGPPAFEWVDTQILDATSHLENYDFNVDGLPTDDFVMLLASVSDIETANNNLTFTSDFNSDHIYNMSVGILPEQIPDYPNANVAVIISTQGIILSEDTSTTITVTVTDDDLEDPQSTSIDLPFNILYRDCMGTISGTGYWNDVCGNCTTTGNEEFECTGTFGNADCTPNWDSPTDGSFPGYPEFDLAGNPFISPDCNGECGGNATLEYDPLNPDIDSPSATCCLGITDIVSCCVDSDNSGFCDDNDNQDFIRDFCGSCPDNGWTEKVADVYDIYGCMDDTAFNYNNLANVPCNSTGDGAVLNDDGTINFNSVGDCCVYTNAELLISPANAFGVSINSFNIFPRGLDDREFITKGFNIIMTSNNLGLLPLGYGNECTTNDVNFDNGACRLIPNHCIKRSNTSQAEYDCYLRYPNPNLNGWVPPNVDLTVPDIFDSIDDDNPTMFTPYRLSRYELKLYEGDDTSGTPIYELNFTNYDYGNISNEAKLSGDILDPINVEFYEFTSGNWIYQLNIEGTYTAQVISTDNADIEMIRTRTINISNIIPITQSLLSYYLPWQGISIPMDTAVSSTTFYDSAETWSIVDTDGRQSLGVFNYNFDNIVHDDWVYTGFEYSSQGDFITQLDPSSIEIETDPDTGLRVSDHINFFDNENDMWKIPHVVDADVRMYMKRSTSKSTLFHYWDKTLHPENYNETTAPLDVQFYFYPRPSKDGNDNIYDFLELKDESLLLDDFKNGYYYLARIDWGDGSPLEYEIEPLKLGYDIIARHSYERSGIYEITGYMLRCDLTANFKSYGVLSNTKFTVRININAEKEDEFDYLGGSGYTFIPYEDTSPIIGGISKDSIYYKSIKRQLGYLPADYQINTFFERYGDRLKTENALYLMDETFNGSNIQHYVDSVIDTNTDNEIYSGQYNNGGEFGNGPGYIDLHLPRVFNTSIDMWKLLGFEESNVEDFHPGNPASPRYWGNIIPVDYSIYNRDGITIGENGDQIIDPTASQEWVGQNEFNNNYYYPVIPKFQITGQFTNNLSDKIPFGTEALDWDIDDSIAPITNENYESEFLLISYYSELIERDVLDDNSGNDNIGMIISDYRIEFNTKSAEPIKGRSINKIKIGKNMGAF
jgi:hypothetical protein